MQRCVVLSDGASGHCGRKSTVCYISHSAGRHPFLHNFYYLKDQLDAEQWNHVFVRDTERKELWSNIACIRVYPVVGRLPGAVIWLIIQIDDGDESVKYQFSNAPSDTGVERFAQMSVAISASHP